MAFYRGYLPALDGIRGVAVLLVFVHHIVHQFDGPSPILRLARFADIGWTGVDLFFVLSGFLITGILLDTKNEPRYFLNFYARRTLRIFPLYYATLLVLLVALPFALRLFFDAPVAQAAIAFFAGDPGNWAWYATYSTDIRVFVKHHWSGGPDHFWTLAVEEHFYLLWPLVVYKLTRRPLVVVCSLLIGVAAIFRLVALGLGFASVIVYVFTPLRMDGLAMGALIAVVLRGPGGTRTIERAARVVLPASAILWMTLMCWNRSWSLEERLVQTVGYLNTNFFYASVLVFVLLYPRWTAAASWAPLRILGKYSYGIYVLHRFVILALRPFFSLGDGSDAILTRFFRNTFSQPAVPFVDGLLFVLAAVVLTMGLVAFSWRVVELPCLRLKRFFSTETAADSRVVPG